MFHVRSHLSTDVVLADLVAPPVHAESLVRETRLASQQDVHHGEQPGAVMREKLDDKAER